MVLCCQLGLVVVFVAILLSLFSAKAEATSGFTEMKVSPLQITEFSASINSRLSINNFNDPFFVLNIVIDNTALEVQFVAVYVDMVLQAYYA